MLSLNNIWNIARIETKTLLRSWFFRIFAGLALVVLFFFNLFIFTDVGRLPWMFRGIPASLPYANLLILNAVQAAIAVFLASDFLKRDKKLDTTEVVYMRSMTNGDYVLGKTIGILLVFMSLNIIVLLMAFIFNLFFADIPVNFIAYVWYPVLISLPTLVFILGLSFLFMVVIRNQAVTFIVLLGYIAVTMFFLSLKYHHLFDYIAYHVPLMYSDFVGFAGFKQLLIQRGMYFCLGIGSVFATIIMIKRLPQSRAMTGISRVLMTIFLVLGFGLGYFYVSDLNYSKNLRAQMLVLNDELYSAPRVTPLSYNLELNHQGSEIECIANITLQNQTSKPLSEYIFSLNSGLRVQNIKSSEKNMSFNRDLHIITINPSQPLAINGIDSLKIYYQGSIDDRGCYLDIDEEAREQNYRYFLFVVNKHYSFVTPEYLLLTPENLWYPIPGVNFNSVHPEIHPQDFATYKLTVTTNPGLTPISQGVFLKKGDSVFESSPEIPLPALSLIVGKYEKKSITVDSVDYNLYLYPDHDYFSQYLNEIGDTLASLIRDYKEEYEVDLELPYLYSKMDFVEVPIQHFSYRRIWSLSQETVQPQMVLLPEKGVLLDAADFKQTQRWSNRGRGRGPVSTPKEVQIRALRRFVSETFLGGEMRGRFTHNNQFYLSVNYKIFPNYFNFVNNVKSEKWPIFNVALESYLISRTSSSFFRGMSFNQGLSTQDKTNVELSEKNLTQLVADPEKREMIHDIIKEKGTYLFSMFKNKLGEEEFDQFLATTLADNRFKELKVDKFISDIHDKYDVDFRPGVDSWYNSQELPGFLMGEVQTYKVMDGDRTRYQILFTVSNVEPVDGLLKVVFRLGGGRGMMGGSSNNSDVEKIIDLTANQTKVVGIVLDEQPRLMTLNTMISKNLPAQSMTHFRDLELNKRANPYDGVRILDQGLPLASSNEIIVDNTDPGFEFINPVSTSFVKRMLNLSTDDNEEKYIPVVSWRPPTRWRETIKAEFYGELIKSAHFVKSGAGDKKVVWNAKIPSSGYYEVSYYYTEVRMYDFRRMGRGGGGDHGGGRNRPTGEYQFLIHADDGPEEILLGLADAEDGWNVLGSYYLSEGDTKVELTNKSDAKVVFADAVRWVKR